MQRLEQLIRAVRVQTNNEDFSISTLAGDPGSGVQDSTFARHFTAAQRRIHGLIMDRRPSSFVKEALIDVVGSEESVAIPLDAHVAQSMLSVESRLSTGSANIWVMLELRSFKERDSLPGTPSGYTPRNGRIILSPVPTSSVTEGLRINYQYDPPELNCRVASVNVGASGEDSGSYELALNADAILNEVELSRADYICIVNRDGEQLLTAAPVESYASGVIPTLTIELPAEPLVLPTTCYVVAGKNVTTHSPLNDFCEDYLVAFVVWRILKGDSNVNFAEAQAELNEMEKTIVEKYAQQNDDVEYPPVISNEYDS